jgi:hypothetical protein
MILKLKKKPMMLRGMRIDAYDEIDGDDVNTLVEGDKDPLVVRVEAQASVPTTVTVGGIKAEVDSVGNVSNSPTGFTKSTKAAPLNATCTSNVSALGASSNCHEVIPGDSKDVQINESNQEERLNALVALIGVATEGTSICAVLEVMILLKPPIYLLFLTENHLINSLAGTLGVSKCFKEANVGRGSTS